MSRSVTAGMATCANSADSNRARHTTNWRLRYEAPVLKGPFNIEARRLAGFTETELIDFA